MAVSIILFCSSLASASGSIPAAIIAMRSVWICSRNDAIGNLAVLGAASGVFATGSGWPDFAVAGIMAALALSGAVQVLRHALAELRSEAVAAG